jgi:hypothetical protein
MQEALQKIQDNTSSINETIHKEVEQTYDRTDTAHEKLAKLIESVHAHILNTETKMIKQITDIKQTPLTDDVFMHDDDTDENELHEKVKKLEIDFLEHHKALKQALNTNLKRFTRDQLAQRCGDKEFSESRQFRNELEDWYAHSQTLLKHYLRVENGNRAPTKTESHIHLYYRPTPLATDTVEHITRNFEHMLKITDAQLNLADLQQTLERIDKIEKNMSSNKELTDFAKAKAWKQVARGHSDLSDRVIYGKGRYRFTQPKQYQSEQQQPHALPQQPLNQQPPVAPALQQPPVAQSQQPTTSNQPPNHTDTYQHPQQPPAPTQQQWSAPQPPQPGTLNQHTTHTHQYHNYDEHYSPFDTRQESYTNEHNSNRRTRNSYRRGRYRARGRGRNSYRYSEQEQNDYPNWR